MALNFTAGFNKGATWTPVGGVVSTLCITGWDGSDRVNDLITTNTCSGGIASRIAGVLDGTWRIQANYDLDAPTHSNPPFIRSGAKGYLRVNTGLGAAWTVPGMIQEVHLQSAVDGLVQYDFTVLLDGSSGGYAYPA